MTDNSPQDAKPPKRRMRVSPRIQYVEKYGTKWPAKMYAVDVELECIRKGGRWTEGEKQCGLGLEEHFYRLDRLLWPEDAWDDWDSAMEREMIKGGIIGIPGPSSSGKSHAAAKFALKLYWAFPNETTVMVTTTTRELLEMRIWGEVKKYFQIAKQRCPWLAGYLLESGQQIMTDSRDEVVEGRDFRNGIKGVPVLRGNRWTGISSMVGVKNKTLLLVCDEASIMPPGFFDALGNLRVNSTKRPFTLVALANPKDPLDAFGTLCEPACGWDQLHQGDGDKHGIQMWETREAGGRCLRLDGLSAPNLRLGPGKEPCKAKLTWKYVNDIEKTYGTGSWQWEMWVRARFPLNVMEKRLFVRKFAERFRAFEEPQWGDGALTDLFALDAAYGAVGGDRCIGGHFKFGMCVDGKQRLALRKSMLIPVKAGGDVLPEDQIARWTKEYCEQNDIAPSHVFFDSTGRGSLVSAFMRLWSTAVVGLEFGGPPTDRPDPQNPNRTAREAYLNFVSELAFALRACIESDQFRGITLDVVAEAEMRAWDQVGKAKQQIEPKEKTRERMKRSPDCLDMVEAGVEGARRLGFNISRLGGERKRTVDGRVLRQAHTDWQQLNKNYELTSV